MQTTKLTLPKQNSQPSKREVVRLTLPKYKSAEQIFRMETNLPLAGRDETHTMREWLRIYGYESGYMFAGKFIPV